MKSVVTTWFGTFLVDGDRVLEAVIAGVDPAELAARARMRREGRLTPEEEKLLARGDPSEWTTRDRRLAGRGLRWDPRAPLSVPASIEAPDRSVLAAALLEDAEVALEAEWDPSIHVQEAVRAASDLDRVRNLIGERIGSWVSRDFPEVDPGDHGRAAKAAVEGSSPPGLAPADPGLLEARRRLGELYRGVAEVRDLLEQAVRASSPSRTPNLMALLGPELAARMVAQAGGLDRFARLPSSTVQVLGAEKAFFEHLRGRAPPPRHGLLFLHPAIQSAPRADRGKLARALAGKVAIAARLDHEGTALDASLLASFEARRGQLKARRARPARPRERSSGSGLPLDRATGDR